MKSLTIRSITIVVLAAFMLFPAVAQTGASDDSKYGQGQDSINCLMNLSLYREFFKHNNFKDAIKSWRLVFNECPASSQNMYIDGIKMYKKFMSDEKNPDVVEAYIDTILLIYDKRIEYFNDEANLLGRKARDLLWYRKDKLESIEEAYGYLTKSVELDPDGASDAVVVLFMNTSLSLYKADRLSQNKTISDYFIVSEIIDKKLDRNPNDSRFQKAKNSVDDFILNEGVLTCEALNQYYEPQFEKNKDDKAFLNKMIDFYYKSGCDRSNMYVKASEQLYLIQPDHESAYKLARLLVAREEYGKASQYYLEAIKGEGSIQQTGRYYYELAQVTRVEEETCKAIEYAQEAIKKDPANGDTYLLLGDLYIESRGNLGDAFERKTAFWAAADKYIKAKNVDPTTADAADKRLSDYVSHFPDSEECFFRSLNNGDAYHVKGCINEYTTVRF